jgi:hypothetical protein
MGSRRIVVSNRSGENTEGENQIAESRKLKWGCDK